MADVNKEQVDLAAKMAGLVERMAAANAKLEKSYKTQLETMENIVNAVNQLNASPAGKALNEISKLVKSLSNNAEELGEKSSAAFGGMADKAMKAVKPLGPLAKKVTVTSAAISGLWQGMRNIVAVGRGIVGFTTSFVEGLIQISASIISIPFKIFNGLVDIADKANINFTELRQAMENLRKEFGRFSGPTPKAILGLTRSMVGFRDTGLSTWRVFGTLAERLKLLQTVATEMGATFQILRGEFVDNGGALLAYQKGLGLSEEQMKSVAQRAITMGDTLASTLKTSTKYANDLGKAFGIDSKLLSRDMAKAMADVKHFSNLAQKEIATAATYARKLGVELDKITGTLDAFETFDSASENVAKLSQSFGVQVDAFKLMEAQNPAEQIDILRKAFRDAGQDTSTFNRQQLKLLASTTGLGEEVVQQVFSQKNLGASMDSIKKKAGETEKKTMTQAEAMKTLADNIERLVKVMSGPGGGFFDHFIRGMLGGVQASAPFRKAILDIRLGLKAAERAGVQVGRAFINAFPGVKQFFEGIQQIFNPKRFRAFATDIVSIFKKFFSSLSNGPGSFSGFIETIRAKFFDYFNGSAPGGKEVLNGFKTFFKTMSNVIAQGITWASEQVAKSISKLAEFITNPQEFLKKAKTGSSAGSSWVVDALTPIGEALVEGADTIWPSLKKLMNVVWGKLVTFFKSDEFQSLLKPLYPVIAAMLFGPAITRALLAQLTTSLFGVAAKAFNVGIIEKIMGGVAKKAAPAVTEAVTSVTTKAVSGIALGAAAAFAAAAVGVSKGIEKYKNKVVGSLAETQKEIGAGTAGLIDMLTLGLLPDDWGTKIAQVVASGTETFKNVFNGFLPGLGTDLMASVANSFKILEGVGDIIIGVFTFDSDKIVNGIEKTIRGLGATILGSFPGLLSKVVIGITSIATQLLYTLIGALGGLISKVGDFFGIDAVKSFGAGIKDFSTGVTKTVSETFGKLGTWTTSFFGGIGDKVRGSSSQAAADVNTAAKKVAEAPASAFASSKKAFSKDPSGFLAVGETIVDAAKNVKEKLASINVDEINMAFKKLAEIKTPEIDEKSAKALGDYSNLFGSYSGFLGSMKDVSKSITKKSVASTTQAVKEMVDAANLINTTLSDGNLNKIDVSSKLAKVASSVGLGNTGTYTIKNKDVVITLNVSIYMDVAEAERIMVTNQKSIIRDRLNFIGDSVPSVQKQTNFPIKPKTTPALVKGGE